MKNKIDTTIDSYRNNFLKYVQKTGETSSEFKEWIDEFISLLPKDARIFELGSALGRDARYFKNKGINTFCTDVVPETLLELSKENFETALFDFRDKPKPEWIHKFEGIFANSVLLHAPKEIFHSVIENLADIAKSGGYLALSLKQGMGTEISTEKIDAPRFFQYYSMEELKKCLVSKKFITVYLRSADNDKRILVILKTT